jgi:hemoglobin-like flavoprotein
MKTKYIIMVLIMLMFSCNIQEKGEEKNNEQNIKFAETILAIDKMMDNLNETLDLMIERIEKNNEEIKKLEERIKTLEDKSNKI